MLLPAATPSLTFHVLASTGKRGICHLAVGAEHSCDLPGHLRAALRTQGFSAEEMKNVILSPKPFEPVAGPAGRRVLSLDEASSDPTLPPIPKPAGPNDLPPQQSPSILVSANGVPLFINVYGGNGWSGGLGYLPAEAFPFALTPPFPLASKIAYRRYWLNAGTYIVVGPQTFSQGISTTVGMEVSDSTTLSAELGVQAGDLSAKLSASTTHSVSISASQTSTQTYSLPETPAGSTCVYTLWQLVEEFILVDDRNQPINWSGELHILPPNIGSPMLANFPQNAFANNTPVFASSPVTFPSAS